MTFRQLICIVTAVVCFSCCDANAKAFYLMKDEPAPFSGYLLDKDSELAARTAMQQVQIYRDIILNQGKLVKNLEADNELLNDKIMVLSYNQESMTVKVAYLIGGMIVGGLVVNKLKD